MLSELIFSPICECRTKKRAFFFNFFNILSAPPLSFTLPPPSLSPRHDFTSSPYTFPSSLESIPSSKKNTLSKTSYLKAFESKARDLLQLAVTSYHNSLRRLTITHLSDLPQLVATSCGKSLARILYIIIHSAREIIQQKRKPPESKRLWRLP